VLSVGLCATSRRFLGFVYLIRVWFEPAGSPTLTQLFQNCRGRSYVSGLSRLPGRGQRVVQSAALITRQVVTVIVSNEVDDRAFRQRGRLVKYESPLFNAGSQWAHTVNVRFPVHCDKRSDELDAQDARPTRLKPLCCVDVRSIDLRVVRPFARLVRARVERLAVL